MIRISVFLPKPEYDRLHELAARRDRPAAELLRDALTQYLEGEDAMAREGAGEARRPRVERRVQKKRRRVSSRRR